MRYFILIIFFFSLDVMAEPVDCYFGDEPPSFNKDRVIHYNGFKLIEDQSQPCECDGYYVEYLVLDHVDRSIAVRIHTLTKVTKWANESTSVSYNLKEYINLYPKIIPEIALSCSRQPINGSCEQGISKTREFFQCEHYRVE